MGRIIWRLAVGLMGLMVTSCAGTMTPAAAPNGTAGAERFYADAAATGTARAIQFEGDVRNVRATAEAATAEATRQAATMQAQATQAAIGQTATAASDQTTATQAALWSQATSTAQAWAMLETRSAATAYWASTAQAGTASALQTAQAGAAQASQTAQAGTVSAIQTATAWPVTATPLAATQAAIARAQAEAERRAYWSRFAEPFQVIAPWLLLFATLGILLAGAMLAYRRLMPVVEMRLRTVSRGGNDAPLILLPNMIVDPDRNFGPALLVSANGAISTGHAPSPELQAGVVMRDQAIDVIRALPHDAQERARAQRMVAGLSPQPSPERALVHPEAISLPPMAPWRLLDDWRGGALPLGLGARGLITMDAETNPHLLVTGTTGSGKTRYGLRPVIAMALADGWLVAIFDRSGLDFLPFAGHPNVRLIVLDNPAEAIGYLAALYAMIQRRFRMLAQAGASTWGRLPGAGARILGVFDEFSNLADSLDERERVELWRQARMVAAEGRKAGVHLALALQDPTFRSLDLRIRRNMTPISFRVRDGDASRVVLNAAGAESLPPRQFLTMDRGTGLVRGVGFAPEDDDIRAFLAARPAAEVIEADWLDAIPTPILIRNNDSTMRLVERIRPLWEAGASKRAMAREVGEEYAGAYCRKLDEAIRWLESATTTAEVGVERERGE